MASSTSTETITLSQDEIVAMIRQAYAGEIPPTGQVVITMFINNDNCLCLTWSQVQHLKPAPQSAP